MKMKIIFKIFAVAAVLTLAFGAINAFAADEIEVYVNEKLIEFDVAPQIIDSRTMIPFRYVANTFGADVNYVEENGEKIVTAKLPDKNLKLIVGNPVATLTENGVEKLIGFDVAPLIVPEGRTLVPVRLIAEAFGCSVGWNGNDKQVIIIDPATIAETVKTTSPKLYNDVLNIDLDAFSGTYNASLNVSINGEEVAVPITLKSTDDATALNFKYNVYNFDFIATDDALYSKEKTVTGDKWEKSSLDASLAGYGIDEVTNVIDADMIISAICEAFVKNNTPTADTYKNITDFFGIMATSANTDGLTIENDSIDYNTIFPLETTIVGIRIAKEYKNDTFNTFKFTIAAADLEDTNINSNITLQIERDNTVKTTKIDVPADKDIITE
ncbi:MAG: copper amine oxidase N-terminal domain-containing protein [Clostridia bacterium]|nr:copper amine oxidase N-terminal domain-containing protein [Clostridia bacterium]